MHIFWTSDPQHQLFHSTHLLYSTILANKDIVTEQHTDLEFSEIFWVVGTAELFFN